jgi:hypothetical protein
MMAALIACAGIAIPALAQDSVSNNANPQAAGDSDALSPWSAADQERSYVLNLTPFTSSWGTAYATAPLAKSSRTSTAFESSLISAQAISRCVIDGDPKEFYQAWRVAGQGVHPTENNAAGNATPHADGLKQFGYAFTEFATSNSGKSVGNIIGGVVNIFPNNSCKLYVNRIVAISSSATGTTYSAALNIGAVDANGNVAVRADNFGVDAGIGVAGNNIAIVGMKDRNTGVVNVLSSAGPADAGSTSLSIAASGTTHSTPNILPEELGGPSYIGTAFGTGGLPGPYFFNDGANSTVAHLAGAPDGRGNLAFSKIPLLGEAGGIASIGTMAREPTNSITRAFSIADVDATGTIVGAAVSYLAPAGLDDPCYVGDEFPNTGLGGWNSSFFEFDHYHSQVAFNGGNSQLALGQDQSGALLAAAIAYQAGGTQDSTNAIGVLRDSDPGAAGGEEWSLAAWNGDINFVFTAAGRGKPVLDGPGGNVIGYISTLLEGTDGAILGPSLSGCTFDAVGNLWFVAPVEYPSEVLGEFDPINTADIHNTLIRAVYRNDGGAPCWDLEAIMKSGDVFHGANSNTDYLVGFIGIADSNSVSSGTLWSQNATQSAYADMSTVGMDTSDNRSTGGVLLSTSIVYDKDGDGMFSFNSELAGDGDEAYNVVLYVGANTGACADINGDGVIDTADLGSVIGQFGTSGGAADINCDGIVDTADLGALIGAFGGSCN